MLNEMYWLVLFFFFINLYFCKVLFFDFDFFGVEKVRKDEFKVKYDVSKSRFDCEKFMRFDF